MFDILFICCCYILLISLCTSFVGYIVFNFPAILEHYVLKYEV